MEHTISKIVERLELVKDDIDSMRIDAEIKENWDLVELMNEYVERIQEIIDKFSDEN